MRKKITRLIGLAVITGVFVASITAQNGVKPMMATKEVQTKYSGLNESLLPNKLSNTGLRADTKAWPDSTITYTPSGEKSGKTIYEYDSEGKTLSAVSYNWENNTWVNYYKLIYEYENDLAKKQIHYQWRNDGWTVFHTDIYQIFYEKVSYIIEEDRLMFGYPLGIGNFECGHVDFLYDEKTTFDVEYDSNGNLIFLEWKYKSDEGDSYIRDEKFEIKYNHENNPLSIERTTHGTLYEKANYEYDKDGNSTVFENYEWDFPTKQWIVSGSLSKIVNSYDMQGNRILSEHYEGDTNSNTWKQDFKGEYKYNANGQCIHYEYYGLNTEDNTISYSGRSLYEYDDNGNQAIDYTYEPVDNNWILSTYSISYPNSLAPNAEVENNTSVGSNNQGNFDLNVNVPADSISSGSITVTFPEGFTLDEENTSLTLDFAADFTLTITKHENNSWLLEIKPKALRSAPLRADEVQNAIQIAYQVDEEVKRGSYDISVNSILFETPYGNIIPEPAITVPADLNRWGVANEGIEDANVAVYVTGNTLYIQTPQSETITVYAINGSKLYEATVSSGTVTVDASAFPQGVLIVKGSSGWVKKIVRDF